MSVAKFKRRPSGLEYVDNAFVLQKDIMMLTSKLSAKWARIYSEPISKLACMQADLVNMANGIQPSSVEDFITRRWLLMMSRACLVALEKRVMDMVRILDLFGKVIEQNSQNMISLIQEYKSGDDNDIYINSTYRCNSRYAYNYNF